MEHPLATPDHHARVDGCPERRRAELRLGEPNELVFLVLLLGKPSVERAPFTVCGSSGIAGSVEVGRGSDEEEMVPTILSTAVALTGR